MSRRTKLIITAIFLVLLTIPVVYLFVSWQPVNPLRFRALHYEDPETLPGDDKLVFKLEVRNTAPVSIVLIRGVALVKDQEGRDVWLGGVSPDHQIKEGRSVPWDVSELVIPPHGVIHCTGLALRHEDRSLGGGIARFSYKWLSAPKRHYGHVLAESRRYLPGKIFELLPKVSFSQDETDLEVHLPEKR